MLNLIGCATKPAQMITDRFYENYKYEFSLRIPEGWKAINSSEIIKYLPISNLIDTSYFKIAFVNHDTESFIFVKCDRSFLNPDMLVFVENEKLKEMISDQLEKNIKIIESEIKKAKGNVRKSEYVVKNVKCYEGPCLLSVVSINLYVEESEFNIESETYNYRCFLDDLCSVEFTLCSKNEHFDSSLDALSFMTKSLRTGLCPKGTISEEGGNGS